MQNLPSMSLVAQKAISITPEEALTSRYAVYLVDRQAKLQECEESSLESLLEYIAEGWQDEVSIKFFNELPTWYSNDPARFRYADEALQDCGTERIMEALRIGYALYLKEWVTDVFNKILLLETKK